MIENERIRGVLAPAVTPRSRRSAAHKSSLIAGG